MNLKAADAFRNQAGCALNIWMTDNELVLFAAPHMFEEELGWTKIRTTRTSGPNSWSRAATSVDVRVISVNVLMSLTLKPAGGGFWTCCYVFLLVALLC